MSAFISFCCNDERGLPAGRTGYVDFEDHRGFHARLQGPDIVFRHPARGTLSDGSRIKLGRRIFEIWPASYRSGVGNWCWDGARFDLAEAQRVLAYLLERGWDAEEWDLEGPWIGLIERARKAGAA